MSTPLPPDLAQRSKEDFDFLVLCQAKNDMGMYRLMRDTPLQADIAAFRESEKVTFCHSDQNYSG